MAPHLTRDDAARIAALAKLEMTEAELDRAVIDLAAILDHCKALEPIDTSSIEDPGAAAAEPTLLRADEPVPSLTRDETFANAPDANREAGLFRVPRVLGS